MVVLGTCTLHLPVVVCGVGQQVRQHNVVVEAARVRGVAVLLGVAPRVALGCACEVPAHPAVLHDRGWLAVCFRRAAGGSLRSCSEQLRRVACSSSG